MFLFLNSTMVNVLKLWTLVAAKKVYTNSADPDQTASEEADWSGSSLFAILTSILWIPAMKTYILFENRKRRVQKFRTFTWTLIKNLIMIWWLPKSPDEKANQIE